MKEEIKKLLIEPTNDEQIKRVAKYNGLRFKLIKREGKRLFIKPIGNTSKPIWINESQVKFSLR